MLFIHCHTPMESVVARIAAYSVRNWHGRVIYTAHGFHFFKGAPKKIILYMVPLNSFWLDLLIV